MSLPIYQRVAVTDTGDVIPGAEYTVINENTGVAQPIYSDRNGTSLKSAPYFADSVGTIQFFIAQGTTFRVAASGGVGTYTDRYVYGVSAAVLALADGSATINRVGSDGSALTIQKNGTTVGSIGTLSSLLTIGSGTTGLIFDGGQIYPWNMNTNTPTDGSKDLGAAGARFKDAYLSGGVVFDPAGSNAGTANNSNTLDSYEEGTWTPNGTGVSVPNGAYYTKIGRQVRCHGYIESTATIITLGGLPFDIAGGAAGRAGGSAVWNNYTNSVMGILLAPSGVNFAFYVGQTLQQITTGKAFYFELTYITNA